MKDKDRRVVFLTGSLALLLLVLAATVSSGSLLPDDGAPPVLYYQGVLTDAFGEPLTGTLSITFRIYDTAEDGEDLWHETQAVAATHGLFGAYLGDASALTEIPFDGRDLYLGVSIAMDSEMTPRMRMATAPYAFAADRALSAPSPAGGSLSEEDATIGLVTTGRESALDETRSVHRVGMGSATYRIPWSALTAGGMFMASSNYLMGTALAQPLIGVTESESFRISAGYWPGAMTLGGRRYRVRLPLILRE